MKRPLASRRTGRRGTVLIVVMVLLLVAMAIAGSVLRATMLDARQFGVDRQALQADRLTEAGLARAAARLAADPGYAGEEWTVDLPGGTAGVVRIRIDGRTVEAVAAYPKDSDRPIRSRRRSTAPEA